MHFSDVDNQDMRYTGGMGMLQRNTPESSGGGEDEHTPPLSMACWPGGVSGVCSVYSSNMILGWKLLRHSAQCVRIFLIWATKGGDKQGEQAKPRKYGMHLIMGDYTACLKTFNVIVTPLRYWGVLTLASLI